MPLPLLIRVVTLFALLLAPLGMMRAHAAAAPAPMSHGNMHAAPAENHCAPKGEDQGEAPKQDIDCTIFCGAMAAEDMSVSERLTFAALALHGRLQAFGHGVNPEAEPPPPRLS